VRVAITMVVKSWAQPGKCLGLARNYRLFVKYDYRFSGVCYGGIQRKKRQVSASEIRPKERKNSQALR
jgi:hypothetical protein